MPITQPSVELTKVNDSGRKPDGAGGNGVGVGAEVDTGNVLVELLAVGHGEGLGVGNDVVVHETRVIASNTMPTRLE